MDIAGQIPGVAWLLLNIIIIFYVFKAVCFNLHLLVAAGMFFALFTSTGRPDGWKSQGCSFHYMWYRV